MLAKLSRALPEGAFAFEPKWDGFRCIALRDGPRVDLLSRHGRPFARYFPEIVEALLRVEQEAFALDGEIVTRDFDFPSLLLRLHPSASRVERLRRETPVSYVAFDVLAVGGHDLRARPFDERRDSLEKLLPSAPPPLHVTPSTRDPAAARAWLEQRTRGIDGVIARPLDGRYEHGKRALVKVKREQTIDCVVAGMRLVVGEPLVASLLLGLFDESSELRSIGVTSSFTGRLRASLFDELMPLCCPLENHPWRDGYGLEGGPVGRLGGAGGRWTPDMEHDWIPLRPERVCEVASTQVDGRRLRHPARFLRWRPDREPTSCGFDQLVRDRPATIA